MFIARRVNRGQVNSHKGLMVKSGTLDASSPTRYTGNSFRDWPPEFCSLAAIRIEPCVQR